MPRDWRDGILGGPAGPSNLSLTSALGTGDAAFLWVPWVSIGRPVSHGQTRWSGTPTNSPGYFEGKAFPSNLPCQSVNPKSSEVLHS